MIERICLLTGNETRCTDGCYKCGCGGEAALNGYYVPIYTIQRVCDNVKDDCITTEGAEVAEEIRNELEKLVVEKAADAQSVKRGKWISKYEDKHGFHYICSNCGTICGTKLKFCFDCGTKMSD